MTISRPEPRELADLLGELGGVHGDLEPALLVLVEPLAGRAGERRQALDDLAGRRHDLLGRDVQDLLAGDALEDHVAEHRHTLRDEAAAGGESAGDALGLHQRLDRERQVRVQPQTMHAEHLEPLVGDLAEGRGLTLAHVAAHPAHEVPPVPLLVHLAGDGDAHAAQRRRHALGAALLRDHHELRQPQALLHVQLAHHAEVDEGEHAGVEVHEQVAGVRVGVEEPVDRELLDERAQRVAGDDLPVEPSRLDGLDVADLDALDELLGDDLGRRELACR